MKRLVKNCWVLAFFFSLGCVAGEHSILVSIAPRLANQMPQNKQDLSAKQWAQLEQNVSRILVQHGHKVFKASSSKLECSVYSCAYPDIHSLNQALTDGILDVTMSIVIDIGEDRAVSLVAYDPLSQQVLHSINLAIPATDTSSDSFWSQAQLKTNDAAMIMANQLLKVERVYNTQLLLYGFNATETTRLLDMLTSLSSNSHQVDVNNSNAQQDNTHVFSSLLRSLGLMTYQTQLSVKSSITATGLWQEMVSLSAQSHIPFYLEVLPIEKSERATIKVTRKTSAFGLQKLVLGLLLLGAIYAVSLLVFYQIVRHKMMITVSENNLSKCILYYRLWLFSPYPIPTDIKRLYSSVLSQLSLCNELLINVEEFIARQEWNSAHAQLLRVKAIDKYNKSIAPLATAIDGQLSQSIRTKSRLSDVKSCLSQAVSLSNQGELYKALYYCHQAQLLVDAEQYHEKAAIEKLISKIEYQCFYGSQDVSASNSLQSNPSTNLVSFCKHTRNSLRDVLSSANQCRIGRQVDIGSSPHNQANLGHECLDITVDYPAVSSLGKQCSFVLSQHGFSLVDDGSKNGSWLNNTHLLTRQVLPLNTNNSVMLANQNGVSPVVFDVVQSQINSSLSVCLNHTNLGMFDVGKLSEQWQTLDKLMARRYWLVGDGVFLCFKRDLGLHWCHVNNIELADEILAKLHFEKGWKLEPTVEIAQRKALQIDRVNVIGAVPIFNRCALNYGDQQLNIYLTTAHLENHEEAQTVYKGIV